MDIPISNIVSASEIQKNYRKIFNRVMRTKKPIVVMRGNKPEVAVVDVRMLDAMEKKVEKIELDEALEAVRIGEEELKNGKLKLLKPRELAEIAKD